MFPIDGRMILVSSWTTLPRGGSGSRRGMDEEGRPFESGSRQGTDVQGSLFESGLPETPRVALWGIKQQTPCVGRHFGA